MFGLWGVVALLLVLVLVGAARGSSSAPAPARGCTHGASSIGPVEVADGKVVAGDARPATEACLR